MDSSISGRTGMLVARRRSAVTRGLLAALLAALLAITLLTPSRIFAQRSRTISFQGEILMASGEPIPDGPHTATIRIYTDSTTGQPIFFERQPVTTRQGIIVMEIGASAPLDPLFRQPIDSAYWIGIALDDLPELIPRTHITYAPIALHASIADVARALAPGATGVVSSINELAGPIHLEADSSIHIASANGRIILRAKHLTPGPGIEIHNDTIRATYPPPIAANANSTLRYDGTRWVEDPNVRATEMGELFATAVQADSINVRTLTTNTAYIDTLSVRSLSANSVRVAGKVQAASTSSVDPSTTLVTKDYVGTAGNVSVNTDHASLLGDGTTLRPLMVNEDHSHTWGSIQSFDSSISLSGTKSTLRLNGSAGSSGMVLASNGPLSTPAWSDVQSLLDSLSFNKITSSINRNSHLRIGSGAKLEPDSSGVIVANEFVGPASTSSAVDLATPEVNGVLPLHRGGTGVGTLDTNGILVVEGAAIRSVTLQNGELLIGSHQHPPVASTLTAGNGITITNQPGGISIGALPQPANGSLLNATLRWNGTAWVENTAILGSPDGNVAATMLALTGKATSASTSPLDHPQTLVTKDYLTAGRIAVFTDSATLLGTGVSVDPLRLALDHANVWSAAQSFASGLDLRGPLALSGDAGMSSQVLASRGAGQPPAWASVSSILPFISFDKISSGENTSALMHVGSGASLTATGTGRIAATELIGVGSQTSAVDLSTEEVAGVLSIHRGGTGLDSIPHGSLLIGNGTSSLAWLTLEEDELLIGRGSASPVAAKLAAGSGVSIQDSGTRIIISALPQLTDGAVTNSSLRWNGTRWTENANVLLSSTGDIFAHTIALTGKATSVSTANADSGNTLVTKDFVLGGNIPIVADSSIRGNGTTLSPLHLNTGYPNSWSARQEFSGLNLVASPLQLGGAAGHAGEVLVSQGTSSIPEWRKVASVLDSVGFDRITGGANLGHQLVIGDSSSLRSTGTGRIVSNAFVGDSSESNAVDLATQEVSGVLQVLNGGTGTYQLERNAVLIGDGTLPITSVTMHDGEVLVGNATSVPVGKILEAGAGITITHTPQSIRITALDTLRAGTVLNSTLRWNGEEWSENQGVLTSMQGDIGANTLTLTGTASSVSTHPADPGNTLVTKDFVTEAGNVPTRTDSLTLLGHGLLNDPIRVNTLHANAWNAMQSFSAGVALSGSTSSLSLAGEVGDSGMALVSNGTGRTPSWRHTQDIISAIPFDKISTGASHGTTLVVDSGSTILARNGGEIVANRFVGPGSTTTAVDLASPEVSGVLPLEHGGIGGSVLQRNAILLGDSTAIASQNLRDGELLIGSTNARPIATQLQAGSGIVITNGPGSVEIGALHPLAQGTSANSTLRWDGATWRENYSVTATDAGRLSADTVITGFLTSDVVHVTRKATSASTESSDTGTTLVTKDYLTTGRIGIVVDSASLAGNGTAVAALHINVSHPNAWASLQTFESGLGLSQHSSLTLDGSPGTAGQILVSQGSANAPRWADVSAIVSGPAFDLITTGVNTQATMTVGAGSTLQPTGTGIVVANRFHGMGSTTDAIDLGSSEVNDILPMTHGGTGRDSLAPNSILIGNGTSPIGNLHLSTGEILLGTAAAPVAGTLTAGTGISIVTGNNTLTVNATSGLPAGSTTNSLLRWSGLAWVENASAQIDASGRISAPSLALTAKATSASTSDSDPGSTLVTKDYLSNLSIPVASDGATLTGNGTSNDALRLNTAHANSWSASQQFASGISLSGAASPLELNGSAGENGYVLLSQGSGHTPIWSNPNSILSLSFSSLAGDTNASATMTLAGSAILRPSGTGSVVANQFQNGNSLTASVDLATSEVNGVLPIANGGTNNSGVPTAGGVVYGDGSQYRFTSAGTSGQVLVSQGSGAPAWQTVGALTGWSLSGNSGTNPSTNFLGTSDNKAFEIHINEGGSSSNGEKRVLRFEPTSTSANILLGHNSNAITSGVVGATISGGGAFGTINSVTDDFGTVAGGRSNRAGNTVGSTSDEPYAFVGAGLLNIASAGYSFVGGGYNNTATDQYSTVAGGWSNRAGDATGTTSDRVAATVGGGFTNNASGIYSTVSGGSTNNALARSSLVGGGEDNGVASVASYGLVTGGTGNRTTGAYGAIGGGSSNEALDAYATVAGGDHNAAGHRVGGPWSGASTVGGGSHNQATGSYSSVLGGESSVATGDYSVVVGGRGSTSSGVGATVVGGVWNAAVTDGSLVGGGTLDTAYGSESVVTGGRHNVTTDPRSFIGGGSENRAGNGLGVVGDKSYATVAGGYRNTASGSYSAIAGGANLTIGDASFGYNGDLSGSVTDLSAQSTLAYFGNVSLAIGNVDNTARELRLYAPNTSLTYSGAKYTGLRSGAASSSVTYTLPASAPVNDGELIASTASGVMSFTSGLHYDASTSRLAVSATTAQTTVDVGGDLALRVQSMTLANGMNNDLAIGAHSIIRISGPTGAYSITGLEGGVDGKLVILYNSTSQTLTLKHNHANSASSARIYCKSASDISIPQYGTAQLFYSSTDSKWIVVSN